MFLWSSALAEEAELAAEGAAKTVTEATGTGAGGNPDLFAIAFAVLALYEIVTGVMTICTGKIYSNAKHYAQYTEESVKAAIPMIGLISILAGLMLGVIALKELTGVIGLGLEIGLAVGLAALCIVITVLSNKKLVKKEQQ